MDATTSGIDIALAFPKGSFELTQIALRATRIVAISALLAIFFTLHLSDDPLDEEERAPLRHLPEPSAEFRTSDYGSINIHLDALASDAFEAEGELKARIERLEGRLKLHGNWFTYLREFSVSSACHTILLETIKTSNFPLFLFSSTNEYLCFRSLLLTCGQRTSQS